MSALALSPAGELFAARAFAKSRAVVEGRAAAGLVSVSTTCRGLPTAIAWADNCITKVDETGMPSGGGDGMGVGKLNEQMDKLQEGLATVTDKSGMDTSWGGVPTRESRRVIKKPAFSSTPFARPASVASSQKKQVE